MLCSRALHYMGWMHMFHLGPCLTALPFNSSLTVSLMKVGLDWGPKHDAGRFHRVINATAEANELFDIVFVTTWRALCRTTPQWESLPGCLTGLPACLGCLPAWAACLPGLRAASPCVAVCHIIHGIPAQTDSPLRHRPHLSSQGCCIQTTTLNHIL
jgi:hypothetical protein